MDDGVSSSSSQTPGIIIQNTITGCVLLHLLSLITVQEFKNNEWVNNFLEMKRTE